MEYNKEHLLNFYEEITNLRVLRDNHINAVQDLDFKIQTKLLEYRINSVNRILDFMHSNQEYVRNNPKKFDILITHCCNKIIGNIDGIEIELDLEEK